MDKYKVIEVKESVFASNDADAKTLREELKAQGTFLLNLMSSPGAGKTTLLKEIIAGNIVERADLLNPLSRPGRCLYSASLSGWR